MLSYWKVWILVTIAFMMPDNGNLKDISQSYFPNLNSFDSSNYVSASRSKINLTDSVYKSALRFLRCSCIPDNPHGIALLDPLTFSWDRLADRRTIRLNGIINGTVYSISMIDINHVRVIIPSTYARIEANLPQLSVSGIYNVTGAMSQALPVFGSGPYSIEMTNVSLNVSIKLGLLSNGTFYMSMFDVEFSPKSIQVSSGNVLGGGPLGDVIQDFLQDSAPQLLDRSRLLIQENIQKTAIAAANRRLAELHSFDDLLLFLVKFGNVTNTC